MPNVTNEEMNRKALSGFPHTAKWQALKPDVPPGIETNTEIECPARMVPDNSHNQIPIKHNFRQTFECDEFDGIVMNESEVLCVFVLVIYFLFFFFFLSFFCLL